MGTNSHSASASSTHGVAPPPKPKKLYQVWMGNNKFCCSGRMIFGPDAASLCLTALLIGGPATAFCVRMAIRISENDTFDCPVLIVGAILTVSVFIFLLLTSTSDPGVVPRNSRPPESDDFFDKTSLSMEWIGGKTPSLKVPKTKDLTVNGHSIRVKYCETCFLYRPPRGSHCSICNNCVQKFDHHCPWVGQCIGARNYWYFISFVSLTTCLCIYIFVFSWINLLQQKGGIWIIMEQDILSVILIVYCFIAVWFVGGLTVFHFYLICTNQTTYENFRYRYDKRPNPYNRGVLSNLKEFLFTKIPPSLVNFRRPVTEDDLALQSAPSLRGLTLGFNQKFDVEVGKTPRKDSNMPLPSILQSLDYSGIDDKLKRKGVGEVAFDPFVFPVDHDMRYSQRSSTVGDGTQTAGSSKDGSSHHTSSPFLLG